MTNEELKRLKSEFDMDRQQIRRNWAYTQGKNPTVLGQYPKKDPDNRIPVPWAKMAVEDMTGYMGKVSLYWDNLTTEASAAEDMKEDEYIQKMKVILDWNDWDLTIEEARKTALSFGRSYILVWYAEDMVEFALVRNSEWQLIHSDDIKPKLLSAIHWMSDKVAHVYTDVAMEVWRESNGDWRHIEEEDVPHFFKAVPLAVFPINYEQAPLFEAEKSLIDAHDQLISKSQNEIDRFNALIALFPGKIDKAFIQKLNEIKAIDDLGQYDHWPEYLEKSLTNIDAFYNNLADRFERLYHKSIKVPDFSDENFGGQSTGIALAYKLLGLEFKATTIETYFKQGIVKLVELINQIIRITTTGMNPDDYKMTIHSERRLPVDKTAAVQIAVALAGLGVSMETVLKSLPSDIIGDVEEELKRIEESSPEVPEMLAE